MRRSIKAGRNKLLAATAGVLLAGSAVAAVSMTSARADVGDPGPLTVANPGPQTTTPLGSGVSLQLVVTDSDPAAGTISYSAAGLPTGLTMETTGIIDGTASTVVAASPVTVTVSDMDGNQDTASFTWTVKNDITVNPPGAQTSTVNKAVSLPIKATDNDSLTPLSYTATGLPAGLAISAVSAGALITGKPTKAGTYAVTVTATDNTGSPTGSTAFTWKVSNVVTVSAPATEKSIDGLPITPVKISVKDTTAGLKYAYKTTNLPAGLKFTPAANGTAIVSGKPTAKPATYATTVTVTDSSAAAGTATIQWTVGRQNVIKVSAPATKTVFVGVKVSLSLPTTDSDRALKKFTYAASALPRGLAISKTTGVISGRPTKGGLSKTTLTVKDATGAAGTAVITWKVVATPVDSVDLEPNLRSTVIGEGLNIQFSAKDAVAGDKMTFSATGLPAGMYLSSKPFMLWGWPTKTGTYTATIHEKGSLGTTDAMKFAVKVAAASGTGPKGQITLAFDGKCLQAPKGAKVEITNCVSGTTERWAQATDGTIRAQGACLDISGSSRYAGKAVQLASCSSSVREQWRQASDGLLLNPASGLCLADPGTSRQNGTVPVMGSCAIKTAELWKLPAEPMLAAEAGYCADDYLSRGYNNSTVDMFACNGTNGQTWNFESDGTIRQSQYANVCLTVHGPLGQAGVKVTLWACQKGDKEQHWTVSPKTGLSSEVSLGGVCLAIPSLTGLSGALLMTNKCSSGNPLTLWHIQ